ncbi:unnamed protein product [Kuraishia capsulata CBS 1993]|uniref:Pyrroline-5-carboxylate reductase catalytic N-terminal domain-containing protein n=1 Tax=Kuraishia capsulata CBS 1993 TaxID=1382522 RepID=W6MJ65_9ASCO|nr:uncharacterized protein KUCA_T00002506001 [Kuraishia capsulata CBS 1993]CDK26534.1 unnamed protein product [Kuraishia capsulata CBS 1993]
MKNIGIIGAGFVGEALALRLVELGYSVKVANSRGPDTLKEFEQKTGAKAVGIADISFGLDVLVIAVPMTRTLDLPKSVISTLPEGAIVVDANNYYPARDGVIPDLEAELTESQWVSQILGVSVVKALNNIIASRLVTNHKPKGDPNRIALPVSGDNSGDKAKIMELVEHLGFTAFDAGPLSESWRQHPGNPAYCSDPTIGELPLLLQRADRKKAREGRDSASKLLAKLPKDYSADVLVRVSRLSAGLDRTNPKSLFAILRLGVALLWPSQ